jgi:hypothetical protein
MDLDNKMKLLISNLIPDCNNTQYIKDLGIYYPQIKTQMIQSKNLTIVK